MAVSSRTLLIFLTLIIFIISSIYASNGCASEEAQESCSNCIKSGPKCAWTEVPTSSGIQCYANGTLETEIPPEYRVYPTTSQEVKRSYENKYLQPEQFNVNIRSGDDTTIHVDFVVHKSYPVDLYFLTDLSRSMSSFITNVVAESENIVDAMKKEVGDALNVGIGSFMDKPAAPFTNNGGQHIYRNILPLEKINADNIHNIFQNILDHNKTLMLSNADDEEGGLEAMVQVAKCESEVGWDRASRHIIIFSTDAVGHLAGINTPNALTCLLDTINENTKENLVKTKHQYNGELIQDYPSVYDLKEILSEQNIQTIFALAKNSPETVAFYNNLTDILGKENQVGIWGGNSIADMIVKKYREMTKNVRVELSGIPSEYIVNIDTTCNGQETKNSKECENPTKPDSNAKEDTENTKVKFAIKIQLKGGECPEPSVAKLKTPGYGGTETVTIKLNPICTCNDCKSKAESCVIGGQECNGHGAFNCGKCICEEGWGGECCDCNVGSVEDQKVKQSLCVKSGSHSACSDRGTCVCGSCHCDKNPLVPVTGKYCDCIDGTCLKTEGKICNGKGECSCGMCKCIPTYEGDGCTCSKKTDNCQSSKGICSHGGECKCNKCECWEAENNSWSFKGNQCENLDVICDRYRKCIGDGCDLAERVDNIPNGLVPKVCSYENQNVPKCEYTNLYRTVLLRFYIQDQKIYYTKDDSSDCYAPANIFGILTWTIGATLLLGLLIIIGIKIIIEYLNRKERSLLEEDETLNTDRTGTTVKTGW